jgi:hypothetical protein
VVARGSGVRICRFAAGLQEPLRSKAGIVDRVSVLHVLCSAVQ